MKQEFSARTAALDDRLGVGRCFDMTARDLTIDVYKRQELETKEGDQPA